MFDLEQSVAEWRRQMLAVGIKTPVPLEELESHLREEIEQQMKSGLDAQEAFGSAVQKMGPGQAVQAEFEKVEAIKKEREWRLMQILMVVPPLVVSLLIGSMVLFKKGIFAEMTTGEQMQSLTAIAVFSLLICGGRIGHGIYPVISAKRIRDGITISASVLALLWFMVLFHIIVPHSEFTLGQLLVTVLWGLFVPWGALIGFILGIEAAARRDGVMGDS